MQHCKGESFDQKLKKVQMDEKIVKRIQSWSSEALVGNKCQWQIICTIRKSEESLPPSLTPGIAKFCPL